MSQLSTNLNKLLNEEAITLSELARRTGVKQPVLHRLSTGVTCNPRVDTLLPVAQYFKVTIDQLITPEA